MNDYLLRHAIDNVWCNPTQDRQFVYELRQLTPKYGVREHYVVDYERYKFPSTTPRDTWHMYQIGHILPSQLGIPKVYNEWMSLLELSTDHNLLAEVYVTNGVQFPRGETYLLLTPTQNLLVCVKYNDRFPNPDLHKPYLHLYSNAYFQSQRSSTQNRRWIKAKSQRIESQSELRRLQIELMDTVAAFGGYPQYFVNGRLVQEISLVTADVGDYVDFILDGSIKRVVELEVKDLPTFQSTLDNMRKYILHYNDPTVNTIEFYDDVALYLVKKGITPDRFSGITYHHNEGNWLRMLTHKDYSTPVDRVQQFIVQHPEDPRHPANPTRWPSDKWTGLEKMTFRMYIRHSGYDRPLVADANRIQELYRLKSVDIVRAFTGADSVNPLWQAANLEKCPYVRFMSAKPEVVFPATFKLPDETHPEKVAAQNFAGDVFGYHEAAHIQANNPSPVYVAQNTRYADLAYNYWENATVFEYDTNGVLLGYYYHTSGKRYLVQSSQCTMVEAITGFGSDDIEGAYGTIPVSLPGGYGFRVYISPVWAGVPTDEWVDITDLLNRHEWGFYDDTGAIPRWVWTLDSTAWIGLVRRDHRFYLNEYQFNKSQGLIRFTIAHWEQQGSKRVNTPMLIPMGQYDVFLNNRPLIENLDYVFEGQRMVICNREYLADGVNTVLVRAHGFCTAELKRYPPTEYGFVEYGVLSNNGQYDIHTHKLQRVIIDGHYHDPSKLVFEEDANALVVTNERNGAPYQIQTPQSSFRDVYAMDIQARIEDDERDRLVSAFMTDYFPQRVRNESDVIPTHYVVFSVFANKVLHDITTGKLKPPYANGRYSEMDIVKLMGSYAYLVPFDLCNREYNTNHVKVYPHWFDEPVGLDIFDYEFYVRVLKLYLKKLPELSPFIYISRT